MSAKLLKNSKNLPESLSDKLQAGSHVLGTTVRSTVIELTRKHKLSVHRKGRIPSKREISLDVETLLTRPRPG
ncbi:unnamed protein product [Nesidiocoris tenuis]|uniref:Uncharacterized protein n=1 Tax=Nesidiocoris tenuis TaxID=355587 RepID=A0A6H5G4K1_9HEMI|nr:unnamed protein product [Nesidiocoris tenuis]